VLPLGDVVRGVRYKGNAATGGSSQGGSYYIITGGGSRGSTAIRAHATGKYCYRVNAAGCCYWGEGHSKVLPPGKHYKRKPQGAATGAKALIESQWVSYGANATIRNPLFSRRGKEVVLPLGTSYGAYDIGRVLPPGKHHRREP